MVGGGRIAYQDRLREVLVAIAGGETGEDIFLVAVTVRATVVHTTGVRGSRREDPERRAPVAIAIELRPWAAFASGHELDVPPAGAVTGLAADAKLGGRRLKRPRLSVEVALDVGRVAVEAVDVPDLTEILIAIGQGRDFCPVQPPLPFHVPENREHVDPSVS